MCLCFSKLLLRNFNYSKYSLRQFILSSLLFLEKKDSISTGSNSLARIVSISLSYLCVKYMLSYLFSSLSLSELYVRMHYEN